MNYLKKDNYPIFAFFVIIFWFIIVGLGLSIFLQENLLKLFSNIISTLYVPDKNLFGFLDIRGFSVFVYFYLILGLSIATVIILKFCLKRFFVKRAIFFVCCLFLILMIYLQTLSRQRVFALDYKKFHGKTLQEKISVRFKKTYAFAQYCQTHFPGKHWGDPVTDIDISKAQNMLTFFSVAYYLYPINIRTGVERPKDCLVIFLKEDPLKAVSAGFKALEPFDSTSLLAVKEK